MVETRSASLREGAPRPAATRSIGARALAESVGTLFLVATVVGSGIMGERLSGGNMAIALLANSLATGAGLIALILAFGPVSGGHFNPVVSLVESRRGLLPWREAGVYILAQICGGLAGVAAANLMFGLSLVTPSRHVRDGPAQMLAEAVTTAGLVLVIRGASRLGTLAVAIAAGGYIASAYWFTASTSFANPAVTLARSLTDSFSGIRLADTPAFIAAQLAGGAAALLLGSRIFRQSA
ncbi:MAG: MIP/aquaporin family protein [Acidobacteriota bacterium]